MTNQMALSGEVGKFVAYMQCKTKKAYGNSNAITLRNSSSCGIVSTSLTL